MTIEVEVELKLKVAREDVKVLAGLELIRQRCIAAPTTQRLRTTYFDTPDEQLRRLGLELRVRRHGASFTQTLKTLSPSMAGLFKRGQWETPVSHARPDLAALARLPDVDAGYRSVLGTPALAESLVPVFSSTMRRSIFPLCMADGSKVALSIDQGTLSAGRISLPVTEVELELESGSPGALFAFAVQLMEEVDVRIESLSKSERGYALRTPRVPSASPAQAIGLRRGMTLATVIRLITQNCLAQIQANSVGVLESDDPECVHQMRVGVRRLRSALRLFSPWMKLKDDLKQDLRWLGELLGATRDAEVLATMTLPRLAEHHRSARQWKRLASATLADGERQRRTAAAAIASARFSGLMLNLCARCHAPLDADRMASASDAAMQPSPEVLADQLLHQLRKELMKVGAELGRSGSARRHRTRIAAKRLRYAADFFRGFYPAGSMNRYVKRLARIQDALGMLNDESVAEDMLRKLKRDHPDDERLAHAVRLARRRIPDERRAALRVMCKSWKRFRREREPT